MNLKEFEIALFTIGFVPSNWPISDYVLDTIGSYFEVYINICSIFGLEIQISSLGRFTTYESALERIAKQIKDDKTNNPDNQSLFKSKM